LRVLLGAAAIEYSTIMATDVMLKEIQIQLLPVG